MENIPSILDHPRPDTAWWLLSEDKTKATDEPTIVAELAVESAVEISVHDDIEPLASTPRPGLLCPFCRNSNLEDHEQGLQCIDCETLAFIDDGESLVRADNVAKWKSCGTIEAAR